MGVITSLFPDAVSCKEGECGDCSRKDTSPESKAVDPTKCALCGKDSNCQMCKDQEVPCWCVGEEIPPALLKRIPPELSGKACICKECIEKYRKGESVA